MAEPLIVLGSGGHAKVVVDILENVPGYSVAGIVSSDSSVREFMGYPVLGGDKCLEELFSKGLRLAFVAIGDNRLRKRLSEMLASQGFDFANALSASATISRRARLGRGIAVMPGAVVNVDAVLEDGVIVNTGATVDHDCRLGPFAHVGPGAHLAGSIHVAEGAFIGAGSSLVRGVSIGAWSVAGAGATVIRSLPENVTAAGTPARILKSTPPAEQ